MAVVGGCSRMNKEGKVARVLVSTCRYVPHGRDHTAPNGVTECFGLWAMHCLAVCEDIILFGKMATDFNICLGNPKLQ